MNIPLTPLRFLERARTQFAPKIGVVDGDSSWTYAEYAGRCRQLANLLESWNLSPGDTVALLSYNTHQLLEAYYGVPLAGGVLLPLNIRLNSDDFLFILNDSRTSVLMLHPDFVHLIEPIRDRLTTVERIVLLEQGSSPEWTEREIYEELLESQSSLRDVDVMSIDEDSVAELFYTSGTTGHPKGVMLTHRNLYLHALETCLHLGPDDTDVQLHTIPLFHVNGWGTPQFLTCVGGQHVMLRQFVPEDVFRIIEKSSVTAFSLVPTMATALVNFPDRERYDVSSVRQVTLGGAASNEHLTREVERAFDCVCVAGYGLTETSPVAAISNPKSHLEIDDEALPALKAMTGFPAPGTEIQIWDDAGSPLPWDGQAVGEIVIRGDGVMKGYLNRPEENEAAFAGGWFHTGDNATIDPDGYLLIVDRKKDIIISGGENISSLEVEKALLGNPSVLECAVIAVPDDQWGEVPKALVVLKDDRTASAEELIEFARTRLAHFKCPKSVDFFESFPKGGTGKILKRELREKYWTGEKKRVH